METRNGKGLRAAIRAVAADMPKQVRTNAYYRERFPELVASAEEKTLAKVFAAGGAPNPSSDAFSRAMQPYLDDPFRGTVERRILSQGETILEHEVAASRRVLGLLGMQPNDIDLALVSSFVPDQLGIGNAAFLAKELGLRRPAWNIESACAGSLVALQMASALVESGRYRNILVAASCAYSRVSDDGDSLSWFLGDGAGAFIIGLQDDGSGFEGGHTIPTTETCETFYYEPSSGERRMTMRCTPGSGRILAETAEAQLRICADGALRDAGVSMKDIDVVVCNTPMAWFASFAAGVLGIPADRVVDTFPEFGNVGAALLPVNLHAAASRGRIKPGDTVLMYAVGSVSSASAAVVTWGDVRS